MSQHDRMRHSLSKSALALLLVLGGCQDDDLCDNEPVAEEGRLEGIVAAHNAVRNRIVDPEPMPELPPMRWSEKLAATATCWARELASRDCELVHSSSPYGENLAFFSGSTPDAETVVQRWVSTERACYTFGTFMGDDNCTSACDDSGGCGHYTQVVWRDSRRVGCGVASCGDDREVWVCNYDPPGNVVGQQPY